MPRSLVHRRPFALTALTALTGLLIAALAACGSAPTPTPTATPTAAPTAAPTATTPTAASWKYSRNFVIKAFTDKEHLTFGKAIKQGPYTFATSKFNYSEFKAGRSISVQVTSKTGSPAVYDVSVMDLGGATVVGKEMIFALRLMEPNAANEAMVWVQSEYDKARADKKTRIDDTKIFGSALLKFWSSDPVLLVKGQHQQVSLGIYQAQ